MEDAKNLYLQRARELEDAGRMKEAEDVNPPVLLS